MEISSASNSTLDVYYATLSTYAGLGVTHEQGIRNAFRSLLETCARPAGWTLVEEHALPGSRKRPDGTLLDGFRIPRGYWEAKDTKDDLEAEIRSKIKLGYDLRNTIFEDTRRAVLYQNKLRVLEVDLTKRDALAGLLTRYFNHTPAEIEEFHRAEVEFREQIPVLAKALTSVIEKAREDNSRFIAAFGQFHELCRTSLNPSVGTAQIQEMLVQHLLTERLFRNVFDNPEFTQRNVIAAEIEKVISALTSKSFSREAFLKQLDYFYTAIENTARTITDFSEKQGFLNTIYERFFQDFSTATADTHGIVYTPQPIVDFMCASVESVLQTEFGKSLSDLGVTILDPCTGTGNFLVNILRRISPLDRQRKYQQELFANEVMLLPYYIASLNIEHAYFDLQGQYEEFPGLCFADTLDLAKGQQLALGFTEENTERMQREQDAAITVIIGNPPYNVGQQNENDNNKNRKYPVIDKRIKDTYVKDSKATKTKQYDAYKRFFRWATDRLQGQDGIVCYVTNNSFVDTVDSDGMRKHLLEDYTQIYHLDLHGNVRQNPKLSGTTHNVFGIQVGVGITIAIRRSGAESFLKYFRVAEDLTRLSKIAMLTEWRSLTGVPWNELKPNIKNAWLTEGLEASFDDFLPIASKEAKASKSGEAQAIFKTYSLGVSTNRDGVVYDFSKNTLGKRVAIFVADYNFEVARWKSSGRPKEIDSFIDYSKVKWSEHLKNELCRGKDGDMNESYLRSASYRPFNKQWLYYDTLLVDRPGGFDKIFPNTVAKYDNSIISLSGLGSNKPFQCLVTDTICSLDFLEKTQCFPLYTYGLDGKIRRNNVTDWALGQFQAKYGPDVTKQDIFYYVYGLLHSPQYREKYKENLKRELPRIPLVGGEPGVPLAPNNGGTRFQETEEGATRKEGAASSAPTGLGAGEESPFRAFVSSGAALAALHVGYEQAEEYPLTQIVNKDVPFSWRVTKMRLNKEKTALVINEALTLGSIPPEAFGYKLGNRSALEWVIDQYQVSTDKRSGIVTDPNRADEPEYIVRLVRRVVTVSVETVKVVAGLPPLAV
ncbi:MAG: type ISP restriction/modification enzyme [Janthinobacterium lividum]